MSGSSPNMTVPLKDVRIKFEYNRYKNAIFRFKHVQQGGMPVDQCADSNNLLNRKKANVSQRVLAEGEINKVLPVFSGVLGDARRGLYFCNSCKE